MQETRGLRNVAVCDVYLECDILRNEKYSFLKLIIGKKGQRTRGARKNWFGVTIITLFQREVDNVQIAMMIANVQGRHGS